MEYFRFSNGQKTYIFRGGNPDGTSEYMDLETRRIYVTAKNPQVVTVKRKSNPMFRRSAIKYIRRGVKGFYGRSKDWTKSQNF